MKVRIIIMKGVVISNAKNYKRDQSNKNLN